MSIPSRWGLVALIAIAIAVPRGSWAQEKPALIIGGADDRGFELAGPQAVIVTANRIVIIEEGAPFFRVLSATGALIQSFGRKGAGPGEISNATFWYDSAHREIVAFDRGNSRVSYYALGDTIHFARSHPSSVLAFGGCVIDGTPWVLSGRGSLIAELKLDADRFVAARKMGEERWLNPDFAQPALRRFGISAGVSLQCDERTRTAVVFSALFGEAHVLSLTTGKDQLIKLLDFIPSHIEGNANGYSYEYPASGIFDEFTGTMATSAGVEALVAHYTARTRERDAPDSYRRVVILPDATQWVVGRSTWKPMAVARDGVYCYSSDPAPTIAKFSSGRCP